MKRRRKSGKINATKLERWLLQIACDRHVPKLSLRACMQIACWSYFNNSGDIAVFERDALAAKLSVRKEAINRALRGAVALGYLESMPRGPDEPDAYRMVGVQS